MNVQTSLHDQSTAPASCRRCNACGGQRFSVMGRRSDGVNVLRCETCGLGVIETVPAQLETYYDDAYYGIEKTDDAVGYGDYRFTAEHGVSWAAAMVQLLKPGGRILDIGCADGTLLAKLPDAFERHGIEVNEHMAARAAAAGVRVLGRDLLDPAILREHRGQFDVVTSIAVFEHLPDLRRGMQVSLDLLNPGGVLLFEVPYISAEHENRVWFESSLEHVFYPGGNALRRLVEALGAYLVGGEVNIRDFASNYIGIAFHDRAMASDMQRLFRALTSTTGALPTKEQHRVRQQLMLIHAARSTPDLLAGLGAQSASALTPALMQRVEQLWGNDLRRLATARRALEGAEALRQQLATIRAQAEALRTQLDRVRGNAAWKLTYPLRDIAARNPRIARLIRQAMKLVWWSVRLELRSRLREVMEQRQGTTLAGAAAVRVDPPAPSAVPPLAFRQQDGLVWPLAEDDEIDPWPPERPLVSVVVPSFNYGNFVAEAVASVLAQTFADLEIIVVEGGSTDPQSRRLTMALDRPRTRVVAQDGPHLTGANRNFGISHTRGKYVCCLDADDMLAPTYIEKAVYLLETYGYDVVSCSLQFFGERNDRAAVLETPTLADQLEGNQMLTCAMFRRSLWRRSGGFQDADPEITGHLHEDWLFWTRLAAMGARMHNMARDYLFLYRRHGSSISTRAGLHAHEVHRELIRQALGDLPGPDAMLRSHAAAAELPRATMSWRNLVHPPAREMRRPVLLLALPFTIIGGAERLLSGIVNHLAVQGWRVLVITTIDPGTEQGDTTGWFEPATSEIYHLPRFLAPERWRDFVRYLVASRAVDVLWVVGSAFMYDLLPSLRVEFPGMRVADLLFNTVGHTANNRKYARLLDVTFVENQEVLQFLRNAGEAEERIALAHSGVDLLAYQPGPRDPDVAKAVGAAPGELIVGFSGRWSEEKDPLAFVEIARRSLHLPVRFVMTGNGPMRRAIEAALRSAALPESRFHLIGEVEDVVPWLRSYDVLVLPSRLDGRPVVVLEALALGVPVLASRVGALPELVEEGVNGFLCQPGNADAFVERLGRLARDPALLARMRIAARAYAEQKLDARAMLACYEERLRTLTQREERAPISA